MTKSLFLIVVLLLSVFSGMDCATEKASQVKPEIIVATYNIRMNTPNDAENAWPNRKEQVKALIRYHEFDIFGTQEGFIGQLDDLSEMNEFAYIGVGRDDGDTKGEHSAIFYNKERFQLLEKGDFWFSETPNKPSYGWEAKHRRICSWGKFKDRVTKNNFFVFNSHFDHQAVEARRQSGILLVNKIKEIAGDGTVFCMGDFNSTPDTEQIKKINSLLDDSYSVSKMPAYGPVGTFNSFDYNAPMKRRIDYIFVSDDITVLKYGVLTDSYDQKFPSDHQPVVIKAIVK